MLPTDITNLITSFVPLYCDLCSSYCNYEVKNYRHLHRSRQREPLLQNIFICRMCKLSNFNFDTVHIWARGLDVAREVDIITMHPCVRLKRYEYIPYGIIVDEPLMFMSDLHWKHNGRFYIRDREEAPEEAPEEGPINWNTDFGQEIGGVTRIYQGGGF